MTLPWLTVLALLPAVGAVVVVLAGAQLAKQIALATSVVSLLRRGDHRHPVLARRQGCNSPSR